MSQTEQSIIERLLEKLLGTKEEREEKRRQRLAFFEHRRRMQEFAATGVIRPVPDTDDSKVTPSADNLR